MNYVRIEDSKLGGQADVKAHYSISIEGEKLDTIRYLLQEVKQYHPITKVARYEASILFDEGKNSTPFDLQFSSEEDLADLIDVLIELRDKWLILNLKLKTTEGDDNE